MVYVHSSTCVRHNQPSSLVSEHAAAPQVSPVGVVGAVVGGHRWRQALRVSLGMKLSRERALDFSCSIRQRVEQLFPHRVTEAVGLLRPRGWVQEQRIAWEKKDRMVLSLTVTSITHLGKIKEMPISSLRSLDQCMRVHFAAVCIKPSLRRSPRHGESKTSSSLSLLTRVSAFKTLLNIYDLKSEGSQLDCHISRLWSFWASVKLKTKHRDHTETGQKKRAES